MIVFFKFPAFFSARIFCIWIPPVCIFACPLALAGWHGTSSVDFFLWPVTCDDATHAQDSTAIHKRSNRATLAQIATSHGHTPSYWKRNTARYSIRNDNRWGRHGSGAACMNILQPRPGHSMMKLLPLNILRATM
jgi:hypothetical protein